MIGETLKSSLIFIPKILNIKFQISKSRKVEGKYIDETRQGEAYAIADKAGNTKKLFLESYGCQMNFSDSEIVASILHDQGYNTTVNLEEADLILLNTCSIREKAEQTVRMRLSQFKSLKKDQISQWGY